MIITRLDDMKTAGIIRRLLNGESLTLGDEVYLNALYARMNKVNIAEELTPDNYHMYTDVLGKLTVIIILKERLT